MSKRYRGGRAIEKYWRPSDEDMLPTFAVAVGLGNRPPSPPEQPGPHELRELSGLEREMALEALATMSSWGSVWLGSAEASPRGATTGSLAAFLFLKPGTPERDALGDALTLLRKRHLLHYEREPGEALFWWLTGRGLDVARHLPPFERRRSRGRPPESQPG